MSEENWEDPVAEESWELWEAEGVSEVEEAGEAVPVVLFRQERRGKDGDGIPMAKTQGGMVRDES